MRTFSVSMFTQSREPATPAEGSEICLCFSPGLCNSQEFKPVIIFICFFSSLGPLTWFIKSVFSAQSVIDPPLLHQCWICCVHSKHTKGSDKDRTTNKANVLTEKRQKNIQKTGREIHKREERKTLSKRPDS